MDPPAKKIKIDDEITSETPTTTTNTMRIGVTGFGRRQRPSDVTRLFTKWGIRDVTNITKLPGRGTGFVTFSNEEAKADAMRILADEKVTERSLRVFEDTKEPKPRKVKKVSKAVDLRPADERIQDQVTPLWRLSYEDQLKQKEASMQAQMNSFYMDLRRGCHREQTQFKATLPLPSCISWIDPAHALRPAFLPILPSPPNAVDGYRAKCEFAFGKDAEGKVTLGFMQGAYCEGHVEVAAVQACKHVSDASKAVVSMVQDYVREHSKWPVYDRITKEGNWRLLMVRHHQEKDLLLMVQMHPQNMSEEDILNEQSGLVDFLNDKNKDQRVRLATLCWQMSDAQNNGIQVTAPSILFGPGYVTETLHHLSSGHAFQFRISAFSFFQSSPRACEVLYDKIGQWCASENGKKTILLDLCCGTGTIGVCLSASDAIQKIYGIEVVEDAVRDARENAFALNNIPEDRIEYICAKVEDALPKVLESVQKELQGNMDEYEVVAVLDPPRSGVMRSVIDALRQCEFVHRLVYVSCNPKAACPNWVDLCQLPSKKLTGRPFRLTRVQPVDMFPHTEHCELLLEFRREELEKENVESVSSAKPNE